MLAVETYKVIEKALRYFFSELVDERYERLVLPSMSYEELNRLLEDIDKARQTGEESDNEEPLQVVTHRLPGAVIKELDRITAKRGYRSRSALIRDLVTPGLEEPDGEDEPKEAKRILFENMGGLMPIIAGTHVARRLKDIEKTLKIGAHVDVIRAIIDCRRDLLDTSASACNDEILNYVDSLKELEKNLAAREQIKASETGESDQTESNLTRTFDAVLSRCREIIVAARVTSDDHIRRVKMENAHRYLQIASAISYDGLEQKHNYEDTEASFREMKERYATFDTR